MVATAQRFAEMWPGVDILWEKRSLQDFEDFGISNLAGQYDLLVIDHTFLGCAARQGAILPLDEHLSQDFLDSQDTNSVGLSSPGYTYRGHHWGIVIDAAAPVSSWRPDLLEKASASTPKSWEELLDLARSGLVTFPSGPFDALMHFYTLCCALGREPFSDDHPMVEIEVAAEALRMLRDLVLLCSPEVLHRNPAATYEAMASGNQAAYCPFAFGYSNFARIGYAKNRLHFGELCQIGPSPKTRSPLGGTALSVSATCPNRDIALEYVKFISSEECQRGLYFYCGGQPGHRSAWTDSQTNRMTQNYFEDTLPVLDRASLRPRYDGYVPFQEIAARLVHTFLSDGGNPTLTAETLQAVHDQSRTEVAGAWDYI
jgi:multiple sugar transport system substrate-binding protein